ncbi:GerAB/ArcD/ProY family transporter [Alkaliphilus peptidifermentans]|uniref:Spore germination protein (Amino acid permease) n=1 Tax=Alkaliphilus peptidifermentans DSM 18978 TaxID=1120976 RepID=A0A1G5KNH5_9FIRM|nr:endospore germination permease [Alkaliphilus peptidifermentans]SCZ01751.1 spore germination protein (amino acid permease) [Alkaliphilus peptidifermentans DSM 18978]
MVKKSKNNWEVISFYQLFFVTIAQLGGAIILYLPGVIEAGRDVWISNLIASIMAFVVIFSHYLPQSLCDGESFTEIVNRYWGRVIGGFVNFYYLAFFFLLSALIASDIYYFGKITMPETPGYVFTIFLIVPAIYAVKLGLETIARLIEFLLPILILVYFFLFILVLPKLELLKLTPIMAEGIKPVLEGAIPNMNFPFAQILPVIFFYKNSKVTSDNKMKYLVCSFTAIVLSTILLTFRSFAAILAFEEATLKTLVFPPFSTIRLIEVGDVLVRLDAMFLAVFYCTTFIKFILTYYVTCEIVSDFFNIDEVSTFSVPIAILIGVAMPFLIPRFDIILGITVPYFLISLPLFFLIPLLLFITIKMKDGRKKYKSTQ